MAEKETKSKVDFNFPIKDHAGKEIKDKNAATILGETLLVDVLTEETKIIKYYDWSGELKASGFIILDAADQIELKKFIIENKSLYVFAKAQMLRAMK